MVTSFFSGPPEKKEESPTEKLTSVLNVLANPNAFNMAKFAYDFMQ